MKDRTLRIRLWQGILSFLAVLLLIGGMEILPALQRGKGLVEAIKMLLGSSQFWVKMMLPIAVMYLLLLLAFPLAYRWLVKDHARIGRLSWHRNRRLATFCGLVYLAATGIPFAHRLLAGDRPPPLDALIWLGLSWLAMAALLIAAWVAKPSAEKVDAFATGDHARLADERFLAVQGRSAVTTLYWLLGLILVVGSLYDILVTRRWPARSLFEAALIFSLWNIAYRRWNARL